MAGVGPYGIEQVDVGGALANAQNMAFNRIRMMAAQKQLEMQELMMNRQLGAMKALQAYAGTLGGNQGGDTTGEGASGSASTGGTATPAPTSMPHASDVVAPPASPMGYDSSGAPTTSELNARMGLFKTLAVVNPEMAGQVASAFKDMDSSQVAAVTARHTRIAQIASGILQMPQNERRAAIAAASPELQSLGLTPQQIQSVNPTDANLRQLVAEGMDIERIAQFSRPDVVSVRQGGAAVTVNPDQTSTTNYESPTLAGPNGELFQRPPALSTMPRPRTATGPNGQKLQLNPQTNQWEPMGGPTPSASGGFQ